MSAISHTDWTVVCDHGGVMAGQHRPIGRAARPGELCGPQRPGEWPVGGPKCRRCTLDSSMAGHPHGCPRTPVDRDYVGMAIRPCYCGQAMVVAPAAFGPCCEETPPVEVPGGCRWCGRTTCRVNEPDDWPDRSYFALETPERFPGLSGPGVDFWVHAGCVDERLTAKGLSSVADQRREERHTPLGVINAT